MSNELPSHPLLKVTLRYHNLITGNDESSESIISVSRPNIPKSCGRYYFNLIIFIFLFLFFIFY